MKDFRFIMVSAMYENGGNTIQRFFDGHPQLFVYPFESQLGTSLINDYLTSLFPVKYRWPEFSLSGSFDQDYELLIDEEMKRHIRTPEASKFKDAPMNLNDQNRKKVFLKILKNKKRSRENIIESFIKSTFIAWKDYNGSGHESCYLGYSPIICVDAEKMLKDFPSMKIIHIIRNPLAAYADTKKRAVPYSLERYTHTWSAVQNIALTYSRMYPNSFYIVKFEDLVENPKKFFENLCKKIGISYSPSLEYPSWNGKKLQNIYPWGTIQKATTNDNLKTINSLSQKQQKEIIERTKNIARILGYA